MKRLVSAQRKSRSSRKSANKPARESAYPENTPGQRIDSQHDDFNAKRNVAGDL